MADPIDIEVKDSVDSGVEKKLAGIAKTARDGHKALNDLKEALGGINTSALADLQRASASHTNALAKEVNAQARMIAATDKSAIADAKAALEKQRLATETQRTAAAEANAARAMTQSEAATLRLAKAQAQAANVKSQDEREAAALANTLTRLKASIDPLGASIDRHNDELLQAQMLYRQGAIDAQTLANYEGILKQKIDATTAAINAQTLAQARGIQNSKAMTQAGLNLSRQFADIGVTAAMGMNPLMILIQQGPQVADAFATAKTQGLSFSQVLKGLVPGGVAAGAVVGSLAAILLSATVAFGLFHRELSKEFPKDITKGMNLTEEQLERVKSKTVTFGDTFMATFTVIGKYIMASPIGDALRWIGDTASDVMDWITKTWVDGWALQIGVAVGAFKFILENWKSFPKAFGDIFVSAINSAIQTIEKLVNSAIDGLVALAKASNPFIKMVEGATGIDVASLMHIDLQEAENHFEGEAAALGEILVNTIEREVTNAREGMGDLGSEIATEALRRARARAREEAGKANKSGGGGKSAEEKRAEALADINRELDDQRLLMGMVGDQLEIETRMQGILNGLARKGIELSDAENAGIRAKVIDIQDLVGVQSQLEAIYDDLTGAQRDYSDANRAVEQLMTAGTITAEQYAEAVSKIEYEYRMATDPMAAFNNGMRDHNELLGKFGIQAAVAAELQNQRNELEARGKVLTDDMTRAITEQVTQRERELMINNELGAIYDANAGAIEELTARTVALGVAHANGMIGAEQYRIGLNNIAMEAANVAIRQNEMATSGQMALASLQSYMSTYQGLLPGLTQSFGDFFSTVADGFSNSIARAIVTGESFSDMLSDVATQAITQLIASLVKLGIQWLITQAIGNTIGTAAAGVSMAQGAAVAAAWAPAAAAVSLATFGANAVPAGAAMTATFGLAQLLAGIPGLKDGGAVSGPGGPRDDKVLRWLSDGEYVVNAQATRANRDILDAMNDGAVLRPPRMADGGVVTPAPSTSTYHTAGSTNMSMGGTTMNFDFSGSDFGGNDPQEMEERFMQAVATQLAPQLLSTARRQANDDMTQRFVRPKM